MGLKAIQVIYSYDYKNMSSSPLKIHKNLSLFFSLNFIRWIFPKNISKTFSINISKRFSEIFMITHVLFLHQCPAHNCPKTGSTCVAPFQKFFLLQIIQISPNISVTQPPEMRHCRRFRSTISFNCRHSIRFK